VTRGTTAVPVLNPWIKRIIVIATRLHVLRLRSIVGRRKAVAVITAVLPGHVIAMTISKRRVKWPVSLMFFSQNSDLTPFFFSDGRLSFTRTTIP
jgi:hypothetical protein